MKMKLHVVDYCGISVDGRRDHNEDTFYGSVARNSFMVADGMGGHEGGEVASAMMADAFVASLDAADPFTTSVNRANREIAAIGRGKRRPPGTTFVGLVIRGDQVAVANVGDSRAYLLRGGKLLRLTKDHAVAGTNMLTKVVGMKGEPDIMTFEGLVGDMFLLCSDGLTGFVPDKGIRQILESERSSEEACRALIMQALKAKTTDNVTAVVVRVGR